MNFVTLTVNNLGVFRGRHDFNLEPLPSPAGKRPVIVFSGHNGAGKSSLFQAMNLALHGSLAIGNHVSRQGYNDFLYGCFHRSTEAEKLLISEKSGVVLSCQLTLSGRPVRLQIERSWYRQGPSVVEELLVLENGKLPDIPPEDYQAWLNDLIPPGLNSVIFFDAERFDALASPEQHESLLEETLRRLLGLDLVEQLHQDLTYHTRRQGSGRKIEELRYHVLQRQAELDATNAELAEYEVRVQELEERRLELEAQLGQQEQRLAAEGGTFAARREALQERLRTVQQEIEDTANQLRELCADLLPFTLAPELSLRLRNRLKQEAETQQRRAAFQLWEEKLDTTRTKVESEAFWQEVDVTPENRQLLTGRLLNLLKEQSPVYETNSLLHHLAQPEQEKLQAWIHTTLHMIPDQARALSDRLRKLKEERRKIERYLQRAPDDELLFPFYAEISRIETALAELGQQRSKLDEKIGATKFQREEKVQALQQAADELVAAQNTSRRLELAERSKLVLRTYQDALTRQRLAMLNSQLVTSFNSICRKEHLLREAHIEPETFQVKLIGADGHVLGPGDFSAGERQLYVMALLDALRKVSTRQLPLVIDTPLARLDEVHRQRFLTDYVAGVSRQVILFATEAELNDGLLRQVAPQLTRVYRLTFNPDKQETLVTLEEAKMALNLISLNGIGVKTLPESRENVA